MKNKVLLMAVFCLLFAVGAVSAQEKKMTNFAGNWELDISKSKLSERSRLESMTMNVTQSDESLTIETTAKRAERAEGEGRGGGFGGGGGRGMPGGDGNQSTIYNLKGKETTIESAGQFGGETKFKAELKKDGKLKLIQTRNIETQRGAMNIKTIETWELSNDGKTLTINRDTETPRGNQNSEMVFMKK
jgi:hypothetical protein